MNLNVNSDFNKWLLTKIDYEDNFFIKDVLEILLRHVVKWYNETNELSMTTDPETFEQKWKEFFYLSLNKGIVKQTELAFDENFQYFDSQYSEDISEIFEKYKEIQKFYNLDLFKDKSYDLLIEFLYEYFDIMEEIDEDTLDEEDFLEYNIYER